MNKPHDFSLPDQDGKIHRLSDYAGKWVVVYFYPKDDTPGCTKEACGIRDNFSQLKKMDVTVFGISKDSIASHKKFSQKYNLNFPVLSDESRETIKAFGAWGEKKFMGKTFEGTLRKTYLIGPDGQFKKTYDNVNPINHAGELIEDIKKLSQ